MDSQFREVNEMTTNSKLLLPKSLAGSGSDDTIPVHHRLHSHSGTGLQAASSIGINHQPSSNPVNSQSNLTNHQQHPTSPIQHMKTLVNSNSAVTHHPHIGSTVSVSTCPTCGSENFHEKFAPSCSCDIKARLQYKIANADRMPGIVGTPSAINSNGRCRSSNKCRRHSRRHPRLNTLTRLTRRRRQVPSNLRELTAKTIGMPREYTDLDIKNNRDLSVGFANGDNAFYKSPAHESRTTNGDLYGALDNSEERCYCAKCPKCIAAFRKDTIDYGLARWDIEGWHERRKHETMKRRERAMVMIVSIVAIIIFIVMSYFGTILFLRLTKLPTS